MDHFHILDAYRSNKKLVPVDDELATENTEDHTCEKENTEDEVFDDVYKAAYQTKDKYDALKRRERAQTWALVSVETMISVMALLFIASVIYSDYSFGNKVNYILIIVFLFIVTGVILYMVLFAKRMFNSTRARMIIEEIYNFNDDDVSKAYGYAQELRDQRREYREDNSTESVLDSKDTKIQEKISYLKTSKSKSSNNSNNDASTVPKPGALKAAIKNGILYTMTGEASPSIDGMVQKLRTILGSETYRVIEESDAYDVIDDIIVPRMVEAKNDVASRKKDASGDADFGERRNQCDEWCTENVKSLVADTLDPNKQPSTQLLDEAWDRCKPDMEEVCHSNRLRTGDQRCAFGCAKAEEKRPEYSIVTVDNHSPDNEFWTEQKELDALDVAPEAESNDDDAEATVTSGTTPGLERLCMEAAINTEDVDAAYYGKTSEENSTEKCYFHFKAGSEATGRGTFTKSKAAKEFGGKLLYKAGHNVEVPGVSPAEKANEIAEEVRSIQSAFDITPYDVHVYDSLRYQDPDFERNRPFYEKVFDNLVQMLKPQLESENDMLVPSIQRINESLTEMTARQFRTDVMWPVAKSSAYLHIRMIRLDQKESYMPRSMENEIHRKHGLSLLNFGFSVAASIIGYITFTIEREAAKTKNGQLTLKQLLFDMWHRHIVALSVITMFWVICYSWMRRDHARRVFNDYMKDENTRQFMKEVYALRTFLFELTDTLPELAKAKGAECHKPLLQAAHTNKVDVINPFASPDELIINTLTLQNKLKFVKLSQAVVKAYDRCNKLDSNVGVPFPLPEVIVYGTSIVILVMGMSYMYSRFNVGEVAQRVERVRELRPKLYMGDAAAAREVGGLLECAENSAETRVNLMKNMFVGMIGVTSIMVTVILVNSDTDYEAMLTSGFMLSRGRCVN